MKTIYQISAFAAITIAAGISTMGTAHAQWTVTGQNLYGDRQPSNNAGINTNVGFDIDSITEAEYLLTNGGASEFAASTSTIHYKGGGSGSVAFPAGNVATDAFPAGAGTGTVSSASIGDNFAFSATSLVTVTGASSANVFFYATTDDGFKLELIRGGVTSFIFGQSGPSGTNFDTNKVSLSTNVITGDTLRFVYFERDAGEFAYLYTDTDGNINTSNDRALVTSNPTTGVTFAGTVVPEAGTLALLIPALGIVATGVLARRRK